MKCAEAKRYLALTRKGELTSEIERALAEHVRTCPACAAEQASFLRQDRSLENLRSIAPSLRDPEANVRRILQRVRSESVPRHQHVMSAIVDRLNRALEVPGLRYALAVFVTATVTGFVLQQVTILRNVSALEARLSKPEAPRIRVAYVVPPESVERLTRSREGREIVRTMGSSEATGGLRIDPTRLASFTDLLDSPESRWTLHAVLPGGGTGEVDSLIAELTRNVHRVLTY